MRVSPNESILPPGTLLAGKYKVTREVGRGGMAAVYEAVNTSLNKRIAVKVLASELAASTIVTERFFREARAAAAIKSPYIVEIYDSDRLEDGRPYICMELLEGESLYDRMARVRLIDVETTVRVITHCARGLAKAHAAGIVHRDLKPENIFIMRAEDGQEVAKLLDFGLAKFYAPVATDQKTARLTREGAVFGTPAYMSPEQVKGQGTVDHRADLWALGCLAFECLIGRPVWNTDQGVAMIFAAVAAAAIPVPSKIRPDLPPAFDAWFAKALARNPDERFQDARELADALARAFGMTATSLVSSGEVLTMPGGPVALAPGVDRGTAISGVFNGAQVDYRQSDGAHLPLPVTQDPSRPTSEVGVKPSPTKYVLSALWMTAGVAAASFVGLKLFLPQVGVPTVVSSTTAPSAQASASAEPSTPASDEPKWMLALMEGQRLFGNDLIAAQKKFKESLDLGGGATARAMMDQAKFVSAQKDSCRLVAIGHPRQASSGAASRPALAKLKSGTLIAWSDAHEQAGHDHVYGVVLDPHGVPLSKPRDLTPEAEEVLRPTLVSSDEGAILLYTNRKGPETGVRVRYADGDGRIGGPTLRVGTAHAEGVPGPATLEKAPDGYWVAWQDERKDGADLFVRKLNGKLEPVSPEFRATDYLSIGAKTSNARNPAAAIAGNALFLVYRVDRDKDRDHLIYRMRLPLPIQKGLDEKPSKVDRTLGDAVLVNEDRQPGDSPDIACGSEGCFIVWRGERGGAYAAMIDPKEGRVVWRTKLSEKSSYPSIGVGADASVKIAYLDAGKIRLASVSRDGVAKPGSVIARLSAEISPPTLTAGGEKNEWLLSWQDKEGDRPEVFFGRALCRP